MDEIFWSRRVLIKWQFGSILHCTSRHFSKQKQQIHSQNLLPLYRPPAIIKWQRWCIRRLLHAIPEEAKTLLIDDDPRCRAREHHDTRVVGRRKEPTNRAATNNAIRRRLGDNFSWLGFLAFGGEIDLVLFALLFLLWPWRHTTAIWLHTCNTTVMLTTASCKFQAS